MSWSVRRLLLTLTLLLGMGNAMAAISLVGSTTGGGASSAVSSLSLANPGSQSGDVLLAQLVVGNSSGAVTPPSGWTSYSSTTRGGLTQVLFYRVAGASEAATYSFSFGSARAIGGLLALRGVNVPGNGDPVVQVQNNNGSGSTLTALSASVATANSLVLRSFAFSNGNVTLAGPATEHYSLGTGAGPNGVALSSSSTTQAGTGTSGNATATAGSSTDWLAVTSVLAPATTVLTCLSDNFDRTSGLGSDWVVRGSNYTPDIVNNRLRLTSASTNVATMANLQRLLPAAGNLIQVQFRLYAYGGSGADGVALVLSDAQVTPQPGAYGGPLGYGTKGGANVGFAGGWLGVGLDEYGNFSNEGGPGSVGQRKDSVAVRGSGSGTTGYAYIAGTAANLNPGIDISGSAAGPGHLYRITVDGRTSGQVLLTVERDSGSGLQPLTNLNGVNVLAVSGQAAQPADFFMSLTGSTGSSTNIHELDDLQLCALQINPVGVQIDHYELAHAGNALTCSPLPVTVKACLDSAVPCTTTYSGTNPALSASLSPAGWSGLSFAGGVANAQLAVHTVSTVRMNVDASTPPLKAFGQTWCKSGASAWGTGAACDVSFADSGLLLQIPNLLAAKPTAASISAVRKSDTALQCVPAFANVTRSLSFTSTYADPVSGTLPVVINGSSVGSSATSLNLAFDSSGTAPLTVRYDDAGQMTVDATYTGNSSNGDAGLVMIGSDNFVSKPYGLLLQTDTSAACTTADIGCPLYPGGVRAGDPFSLRITAVAWQSDGEALTAAALADNPATPNFRLGAIALSSQVQAPAGGSDGALGLASYDHALGSQTTLSSQSISEVGVFRLTATPAVNAYLGETVSGGSSGLVGRFAPAFLRVSGSAALTPSCGPTSSSPFSYQGQPMAFASNQEPLLTVTGANRQNGVTGNYDRGAFWRLDDPLRDAYLSVISARAGLNSRLAVQGSASLSRVDSTTGDGLKAFRWTGEQLLYTPALLPASDDYPVAAAIRQGFAASALTDLDGACYLGAGAACSAYSFDFGGSDLRLGRLRIANAHGSELHSLALAVTLESWQSLAGGSFQQEGLDTCTTAPVLGAPLLDGFTGNLAAGETTPTSTAPVAGAGSLLLSAPGTGNDGSVQVRYAAMPNWLYYAWDGATRSEARGLASFGIYKGAAPLIFRRELYR